MSLMETKIVQVPNETDAINAMNEEWGSFGWIVQNVQITHSQDSKTYFEGYGDTVIQNVETTTINYATITYQRDRKMEHYDQLRQLEAQYTACAAEISAIKASQPADTSWIRTLMLIIFWPVGLYYLLFKGKQREKEREETVRRYNQMQYQIENVRYRMRQIAEQARSML